MTARPASAALAVFPPIPLQHVSTRYYPGQHITSGTSVLSQADCRLCPFWVPVAGTYDRIATEVTVVGESGCKTRMGIYAADQTTGIPLAQAPLLDAGQVATDVGTGAKEITISVTLPAGLVYLTAVNQLCPTTPPTIRTTTPYGSPIASAAGSIAALMGSGGIWIQGGVTGALPTWGGAPGAQTVYPRMYLRKA